MILKTKIKFICICLVLLCAVSPASAGSLAENNFLQDIFVENKADGLRVRLAFKKPILHPSSPVFFKRSALIDFPNVHIKPDNRYFPVNDSIVAQIYASQFEPETLRVRFILDGSGADLEKKFKWNVEGRFLNIMIMKRADSDLDRLLTRARLKQRHEKKVRPIPLASPVSKTAPLRAAAAALAKPESKWPVSEKTAGSVKLKKERFATFNKNNSGAVPGGGRNAKPVFADSLSLRSTSIKMLYMLMIVLGMMFAVFYLFKRFVWKNSMFGGTDKPVKVLSTGYLGPKKSIALVEVAGEVLVLGIANDNITLLSSIKDEERVARIKNSENRRNANPAAAQKNGQYRSGKSSAVAGKKSFADHMEEASGTANKYSASDVGMMIRQNLQKMGAGS